ncbi:MAG: elongation factor 4 [Fibrobacteria bacterium]|nr:elongation factor 4 [Fibrobacteria bacterium]
MHHKIEKIRNFCIIAHIDHGKSTLADRLLDKTRTLSSRVIQNQVLDDMDLERERGITIKSHAIRMEYEHEGEIYILNLIDTPGHVDFTYEVTRCLAACEGVLLIVDATQGIEAQTLSNLYLAMEQDLVILPVINKIDLPSANTDAVADSLADLIGCESSDIPRVSAKQNIGIDDVLDQIVKRIPFPVGDVSKPPSALIFDSIFDTYRGAIIFVKMFDGELRSGSLLKFMSLDKKYECTELGYMGMDRIPAKALKAGEVGYIIGSIKNIQDTKIGDTITDDKNPCSKKLMGFKDSYPMVFAGLYPVDPVEYELLGEALEKLQLNDSSLSWVAETSEALGFGFRAGFLGLLHLEIIRERLDREFNVRVISTAPNVVYQVHLTNGGMIRIDNPGKLPEAGKYENIEEPFVKVNFISPKDYVGTIMKLGEEKRGIYLTMEYITEDKVQLEYEFPLGEIMFDFYDRLKSTTRGYASMDYEHIGYRTSNLVKLDILINGNPVDAFSVIIHKDKAYYWGQALCVKLKELIPRQMFEVAIQAAVGTRVISRTTVKAFRKNVTAKCYGGDISRKRKLLEKQKEGKKKMKSIGNVDIPQEAFMAVLSMNE